MESPTDPHTDDELMTRVADGDQQALTELITRWQRRIFVFIHRSIGDADKAEELTQDVFWCLWQARERYQPQGKMGSYLFQIATRLCLQHWRAQKSRPRLGNELPVDLPSPSNINPRQAARDAELAQALKEALATLPENQRLALELSRLEGLGQAEVATIMECSVGAIEQLIYRARQTLRKRLAPLLEDK